MGRRATTAALGSIYYIHPLLAGPLAAWPEHLGRARALGCSHVCVGPVFATAPSGDIFLVDDYEQTNAALQGEQDADALVRAIGALCREADVALLLDLPLDRIAAEGTMARSAPHWFYRNGDSDVVDPRQALLSTDALPARFEDPTREAEFGAWWTDRIVRLVQAGCSGFRFLGLSDVQPRFLQTLVNAVRREAPSCLFLGWTPGVSWSRLPDLESVGFDAVFASTAWWDRRATWFIDEYNALRRVAGQIVGVPEAPFEERLASRAGPSAVDSLTLRYRSALRVSAATSQGLLLPMGLEYGARRRMDVRRGNPEDFSADRALDLTEDVAAANIFTARLEEIGARGEMRTLSGPTYPLSASLQVDTTDVRTAVNGVIVVINTGNTPEPVPDANALLSTSGAAFAIGKVLEDRTGVLLDPGDVRAFSVTRTKPVIERMRRGSRGLSDAINGPRVAIERVTPATDGGAFPIKRIVGQPVTVEADVFTDGHDILACELLWKSADEKGWSRVPLTALSNDRWQGSFTPTRIGRHLFCIEGWRDDYASLCHEIEVKHEAGIDIALELTEARVFLEKINECSVPCSTTKLATAIETLNGDDRDASVHALTARATIDAVAASGERPFCTQSASLVIDVERPQAAFASWYELFPRSQSGTVDRHGTFDDVIRRLPDVRRMGFDVLYFPPIHPIGKANRKGPNNTLTPAPDDPGSPYAIGSADGGHDAIHPELGTIEDFRRLVAAARENGLEIALDFAIQCSPDHPWLQEHPDWFKWRSDGTIKYAENPPKKYQDIVNVDFYCEEAPGLWTALRDIVLYWVKEGVRIFRVDNPHTKPLPFWQWMIADVRARYPDVIFLSEAFTRPKVMYRLAKVGFSQSYTYFTWRNTKQELTEYLTELTTTEVKEFFRPHFFVNTPDINPYFLQTSGRPGFLIRAALAATLSGLWGVYAGFEVCEFAPLPGREEYLDSEKYEIRVRDQNAPGNIVAEISMLNRIRRSHPELHSHLGVKFYNAYNDQILLYGKLAPSGDHMILIAVSLDPHVTQEATFELPLWEWKLPDSGSMMTDDLMREKSEVWTGKLQRVRLDPADLPFAIWRISPLESAL